MSAKTALVLLHEGVEEMEFVAPVDILRRGGVEVTVASTSQRLSVTGRSGIQIKADLLLTDALYSPAAVWDLLVIPGGPGVSALRKCPLALDAVKRHKGRLIGAICAAPLVLLDAGILTADGSLAAYTAHPATAAELPAANATQAVIRASIAQPLSPTAPSSTDDTAASAHNVSATDCASVTSSNHCCKPETRLITSRGAGTATAFALALLEELIGAEEGRQLAASVAASICLTTAQ